MKVRLISPFDDAEQIWIGLDEPGMRRKVFRFVSPDTGSEEFMAGITIFEPGEASSYHIHPESEEINLVLSGSGIVVSEGACLFVLERLDKALARNARIYGELVGYAMNSDARDFVLPYGPRQAECMQLALDRNPDNASALNYIGYTWAERGERLDDAEATIRSALAVEPEFLILNLVTTRSWSTGASASSSSC